MMIVLSLLLLLLYVTYAHKVPSAHDFKVDLPKGDSTDEMYAGHIPLYSWEDNERDKAEIFFWFVKSRNDPAKSPLVVWINGGPGCSSLLGMMYELGPFIVDENLIASDNPQSWANFANMLFVDNPVNVGYSYSSNDREDVYDEDELGADFVLFLNNWMKVFDFMKDQPLFVFGESYAGIYVPSIARSIVEYNLEHKNKKINLKGIAIGNGWIDSFAQTASYPTFAHSHGLIDTPTKIAIDHIWNTCLVKMQASKSLTREQIGNCGILELVLEASGNVNEFDMRLYHPYSNLLGNDAIASRFLNDPDVRKAIHLSHKKEWAPCNDTVDYQMRKDSPVSVVPTIVKLLDEYDINVLLYSGLLDYTCNFYGTQQILDNLEWKGSEGWRNEDRYLWKDGSSAAGYAKSHNHLTQLLIINSGHLVPMDQPERSLDMLWRFTRGESFLDGEPLPTITPPKGENLGDSPISDTTDKGDDCDDDGSNNNTNDDDGELEVDANLKSTSRSILSFLKYISAISALVAMTFLLWALFSEISKRRKRRDSHRGEGGGSMSIDPQISQEASKVPRAPKDVFIPIPTTTTKSYVPISKRLKGYVPISEEKIQQL